MKTTEQVHISLSFSELIKAIEQLSPKDFEKFMSQILVLRAKKAVPSLSEEESILLMQINKGLPQNVKARYDALRMEKEAATLSDETYQELLALTEQIEAFELQRVQNLVKLAELRQTSLRNLMTTLDIEAPTYV